MRFTHVLIFIICCLSVSLQSVAQEVSIELGPNEIGLNEQFTITVKIKDDRLRRYDDFPDIPGFEKAGISTSSSTNIVNGQVSSSQSVTQTYLPTREGTFKLSPFRMNVNDTQVSSSGSSITVGPARQGGRGNNPFDFNDPFDDFFGRRNQPQEFVDVQDDAFLALSTDKDSVYLGEGFTTTLAFYVSDKNQAPLQFYDLGKQLTDILKDIKPSNAWEENFNIENINGKPVSINGQNYTQYKIYQATFFPLNQDPIKFPEVGLKMIKYKVAKNPSFFGRRRQEDFKTFYSQPKQVYVKALPEHPLRERVAVGDYRLEEEISDKELTTGKSFNYTFKIVGEGNISAIEKPDIKSNDDFDVYAPSIEQNISRRGNRVMGSKAFSYFAVPNEPGEYQLGKYFNWVFFNTSTQAYDTLRSDLALQVSGKSRKNDYISAQNVGTFYDRIDRTDNKLASLEHDGWLKIMANVLIIGMLALAGFAVFKK
ncbi:BatD family protein [Porifericola rhodea]|uniref:BatD family protein n=1 Tax=Porifericola rhodea TaxID=930972 RepID=UPI002666C10C|nr:BatD family protein [Porifericola rhodea]WKN32822.1 BatD family protein [Porifericola rhodea]